ncbi:hypothetical protein D3C77_758780 [compost metagenome]
MSDTWVPISPINCTCCRRRCSFSLSKIGLMLPLACSTSRLSVATSCCCPALSRISRVPSEIAEEVVPLALPLWL